MQEKNKEKARMVKNLRLKEGVGVFLYALWMGVFRAFMKKSLFAFSVFAMMVAFSAFADVSEGYTEYTTFPTMSGTDYMKEKSVYKNAAVAANMLGITSGTIIAEPVFVTVSCDKNQYLTSENTCLSCPEDFPYSTGEAGGVTKCYKTVARECTKNTVSVPANCQSVTEWNDCACETGTYKEYSGGATQGETANYTCEKTPKTVTAMVNAYVEGAICKTCPDSYPNSDGGNVDASGCYYTCPNKIVAHASSVMPVSAKVYNNGNATPECKYNITCNEGYEPAGNGTLTPSCVATTVTCAAGEYLPASATSCSVCPKDSYCGGGTFGFPKSANQGISACPDAYPYTDATSSTTVTACYKTVTRGCTQNSCVCQGDAACVCADCDCAGETYKQYANAAGNGDGATSGTTTNETCNQTVATTTCNAGYYMNNGTCTACAKGTYKTAAGNATSCAVASEGYYVDTTAATSQKQCPTGLVSPQGTISEGACGKIMYVDNSRLYLTSEKQTSPALAVKIDGRVYYARTTVGAKAMSKDATNKSLRTKIDGVEYSIHDNTVQGE